MVEYLNISWIASEISNGVRPLWIPDSNCHIFLEYSAQSIEDSLHISLAFSRHPSALYSRATARPRGVHSSLVDGRLCRVSPTSPQTLSRRCCCGCVCAGSQHGRTRAHKRENHLYNNVVFRNRARWRRRHLPPPPLMTPTPSTPATRNANKRPQRTPETRIRTGLCMLETYVLWISYWHEYTH